MSKYYLTTAIDYVNGKAHIGHAYEKIMADVIARHLRQRYDDVYFLTGTDEHGAKIQKTAAVIGCEPIDICNQNSQNFQDTWKLLDISNDNFIRTTDENHKKAVQKIFQKLVENGDIYKHSYEGLYCSGCECFLNSRELTPDGLCPIHQKEPEKVVEENYFFRLTKYKDKIIEHIKKNSNFILPQFRANEVLKQLENIEDISVSRTKESVSWGIEVEDDPSQIIYVWIDALSNYITGLGYDSQTSSEKFDRYWNADLQIIGKDILKFHAIYWCAILLGLGLELPKTIFAHGWITIDQTKMSKSTGNVIAPKDILDGFKLATPDALRYFMMVTAMYGKDGNYSDEEFKDRVNADLANNIGNLLNRTLNMSIKYFDGYMKQEFVTSKDIELAKKAISTVEGVKTKFDKFEISEAANLIVDLADNANKYVNDQAPWRLAKEGKNKECAQVLYNVLETMRYISVLLYPLCPNISTEIWSQLGMKTNISEIKLDSEEFLNWGAIKPGRLIEAKDIKPVFLRLESDIAGETKKKSKVQK